MRKNRSSENTVAIDSGVVWCPYRVVPYQVSLSYRSPGCCSPCSNQGIVLDERFMFFRKVMGRVKTPVRG